MKIICLALLLIAANFETTIAAPVLAHPLLGKPGPDFQINDLAGKPVKLSELHGKIIVLDFWRTQCPPCIAGLPVVTKVTSARKGQGVVFYAINLNETSDAVRAFQKRRNLEFPVLLDSDRKVADLYQVDGVPVTFIIDREGKIQAVDFGYKADRETKLSHELDTLLNGKPLL